MSLTYAKFKSLPPEKPKKIVKLPNDQEKFDQCKKDIKELTEQYNQINKKIHDTKTELKRPIIHMILNHGEEVNNVVKDVITVNIIVLINFFNFSKRGFFNHLFNSCNFVFNLGNKKV